VKLKIISNWYSRNFTTQHLFDWAMAQSQPPTGRPNNTLLPFLYSLSKRLSPLFSLVLYRFQTNTSLLYTTVSLINPHFTSLHFVIQEAQLMLTNPRDAFRGQSRSLNTVAFDMLGMVWYIIQIWTAVECNGAIYCTVVTSLNITEILNISKTTLDRAIVTIEH